MRTFEQLRKYIKENIPDPFKSKKGESPDFEKELKTAKSKGTKTFKQKSLNLYKAGGPFVPEKEVSQKTGKTVKMEPKPQFGKPKSKNKAPDRTGLKKAISDVRASDKRLYDAGVGKKPSLVQQRKYTISRIKELSRQTTRQDAYNRAFGSGSGSTEGSAGASGSSKTVTPTKPQKSASATNYTKKINQANKNRKEFTGNKKSFQKFKKQADAATNNLVSKREVVRSSPNTKDVKTLRGINKQIRSTQRISNAYDAASKGIGNPNAPVVASDLKTVTDTTKKNSSKSPSFEISGRKKRTGEPDLPKFVKDKTAPRSRNPWTTKTKMGNKVTMSSGRAYAKTAVADSIKRGFKGSAGRRAVVGKGAKIVKAAAKKHPIGALALGAAGLIGTYYAGKSLFGGKPKDTLTIKDFTKLNKMPGRSSKGITKGGEEVRRDFFMTKKQKENKKLQGKDIISTNRLEREKNFTNKLRSKEYRTP